ncbi:hypothetical protein G5714_014811 [Onychostoma macrolepis]|uniref:Uncharacterized protein n=1 Tax=Onychostoma macrolepis TaxID=369639 RepID=A0A7J6C9U7_9TELE|nr:hypothetical protein G5714_014811 [Onychostoma macrolepis]
MTALALWVENSAISLKLFKTLKQRHQSLPHVTKHSRFPLSPWSTTMATSKIICAVDIRWNNRHLSHYFLVVPDLPHDIYIGADIIVRLNACIDTVNDIIWAPMSSAKTTWAGARWTREVLAQASVNHMLCQLQKIIVTQAELSRYNRRPKLFLGSLLGAAAAVGTLFNIGMNTTNVVNLATTFWQGNTYVKFYFPEVVAYHDNDE